MHGLKETDGEDVRRITIDAPAKVAPKIQDHLDRVVDVVHRLDRKSSLPNANPKRACKVIFVALFLVELFILFFSNGF